MAEPKAEKEPTIVERWLQDQQQWQKTVLSYLDSMTKNDEFLVHLGNAMRGSLLAGKPYPTPPTPGAPPAETPADDRLDRLLHAIHELQGQMHDVLMTLEGMRDPGIQQALPLEAPSIASRKTRPARVTSPPPTPRTRKRKVP